MTWPSTRCLLSREIWKCHAFQVKGLGTAISLNALSYNHILQVKIAKNLQTCHVTNKRRTKQASRIPTTAFPKTAPVSCRLFTDADQERSRRNHRILHARKWACSHESLPSSMFPIQCPIWAFRDSVYDWGPPGETRGGSGVGSAEAQAPPQAMSRLHQTPRGTISKSVPSTWWVRRPFQIRKVQNERKRF